jgi:hypothetical protein
MPVVYVTVPPAATPKMLASEFARFAGVPVRRGQNQADITNAVCDVLARLRADLVLVDEIHNLNLATRRRRRIRPVEIPGRADPGDSSTRASAPRAAGCSPEPAASRSPAGSA